MKKFEESDLFVNTIKAHPRVSLFGNGGKIFLNDTKYEEVELFDFLPDAVNTAILTESFLFLTTEFGDYLVIE